MLPRSGRRHRSSESPGCWRRAAKRSRPLAPRRGRVVGGVGRDRSGARWDAASLAGGPAGAAADRDLDAVHRAVRGRGPVRRPAARGVCRGVLRTSWPRSRFPATRSPRGRRGPEAVQILTAHASKGLEWDLVCVAARPGGQLAGPAPARLAARFRAAGRRRRWARRRRSTLTPQLQRSGGCSTSRPPGRGTGSSSPRCAATDEQPSRFLDELDPVDGDRPLRLSRLGGVHLPGLVAELRAAVCDPSRRRRRPRAAAAQLARLAIAGVAGADPDQWWGLAPLSDARAGGRPRPPVPVSPSRIESFLRCELQALLEQLGARDDDEIGASLGTLIHEVAATAPPEADLATLEALVDERWHRLDFGAAWLAVNQRERARTMLAKLVQWYP